MRQVSPLVNDRYASGVGDGIGVGGAARVGVGTIATVGGGVVVGVGVTAGESCNKVSADVVGAAVGFGVAEGLGVGGGVKLARASVVGVGGVCKVGLAVEVHPTAHRATKKRKNRAKLVEDKLSFQTMVAS